MKGDEAMKRKTIQVRISERESVSIDDLCQVFVPQVSKSEYFRLALKLLEFRLKSKVKEKISHDGTLEGLFTALFKGPEQLTLEDSLQGLTQQVAEMRELLENVLNSVFETEPTNVRERLKKEILSKKPANVRELTLKVEFESLDAVIDVLKELNANNKIVYDSGTGKITYTDN